MKKVLCIDMDSVIVDLMTEWHGRYNRDYADDLTVERVLRWDAKSYVKPECGTKIYDYLNESGLFSNLKPLPHAIEVLERLSKRFDILIVTSSPSVVAYREKEEWVLRHLPFIGRQNLIFAHRKDMICGDLLFDDAPHNLQGFLDTDRVAVAMDYPYNRDVPCLRVSGWLEFEEKVDSFLAPKGHKVQLGDLSPSATYTLECKSHQGTKGAGSRYEGRGADV